MQSKSRCGKKLSNLRSGYAGISSKRLRGRRYAVPVATKRLSRQSFSDIAGKGVTGSTTAFRVGMASGMVKFQTVLTLPHGACV